MKLLIIEAYHGGHHTNYIEALLPSCLQALAKGIFTKVVIAITQTHFNQLKRLSVDVEKLANSGVTFDISFPNISPAPSLRDRLALFKAMNNAVQAHAPDYLLATSADYDVMVNAVLNRFAHYGAHTNVKAAGIFHYGLPKDLAQTKKEKLKQTIYETAWHKSSWQHVMMVNPVVYESLQTDNSTLKERLVLLPDPAPKQVAIDQQTARQQLGLPEAGFLLGFVGMMDARKAVPQVLIAFDSISHRSNTYLVLAGQLALEYQQLIKNHFKHLLDSGKLILINRYLSQDEVEIAYQAIDVVTLLQYKRANLSANLIKAMIHDKPIIADDYGYTGMMMRRFKLGYACEVDDLDSIQVAMQRAIHEARDYTPINATKRLKTFHEAENFGGMIVYTLTGQKITESLQDWDWVCEAQ